MEGFQESAGAGPRLCHADGQHAACAASGPWAI